MASLASCQSGRNGGAAGSKTEITDPNTAFSQGGANTNSAPDQPAAIPLAEAGTFLEDLVEAAELAWMCIIGRSQWRCRRMEAGLCYATLHASSFLI